MTRPRAYPDNLLPLPLKGARRLLSIAVIGAALVMLFLTFQHIDIRNVGRSIQNTTPGALWACAELTAVSLSILGIYEVIAAQFVAPKRLTRSRAWFVGIVANAVSNTVGFHALTATAIRYRLYSQSGLTRTEIVQIVTVSWSALAFGFAFLFCVSSLAAPSAGAGERVAGLTLLVILPGCAWYLGRGRKIQLSKFSLALPPARIAVLQMLLGGVEMAAAVGGLYILLPAGLTDSFVQFSLLYIGAVLLGIISHSPGGLGVFEAAILTLSSAQLRAPTLAALLLYRVIYNLVPFLIASTVLAANELMFSWREDSAG